MFNSELKETVSTLRGDVKLLKAKIASLEELLDLTGKSTAFSFGRREFSGYESRFVAKLRFLITALDVKSDYVGSFYTRYTSNKLSRLFEYLGIEWQSESKVGPKFVKKKQKKK